jgi:hypothetical protein
LILAKTAERWNTAHREVTEMVRTFGWVKISILLVGLGLVHTTACASRAAKGSQIANQPQKPNEVVLCLSGADRQAENDQQEREILRALEDLRTLDPVTLKNRLYADYQNVPGRWTLATLLKKYFVSREPHHLDEGALYRDAQSPEAREVIEKQIRAIREGRQDTPSP